MYNFYPSNEGFFYAYNLTQTLATTIGEGLWESLTKINNAKHYTHARP